MRKISGFHGGIHPAQNKAQSSQTPIVFTGIPPQLVFPLSQHIGSAARPVVSVGQRVLKGQVIAEPVGFVSVPVHASTSGTVRAIEERVIAHPSGHAAPCIVLTSDGADEWVEHSGVADYRSLSPGALLERIRGAGIAGMGGAGFPAAVKLALQPGKKIDTLIINGTECEPYITADDRLMRERAAQVIQGAQILAYLVAPGETLVGVEDDKPESLAALRAAAAGSAIEIVEIPTKYPSGGEKQLVEILTGRQVPSGGLPADIGVICQNVGTAAAVYQAIIHGRPLISRITTVTGAAVRAPGNFDVLLGTPMHFLLERAGWDPGDRQRVIMGGPMMGFTVASLEAPVVKTTNCLLAPTATELPTPPPAQACIRCGMCAQVCPASLLPQQLFWFAQGREFDKLEQHNLFDCIECGACSWVCPSNIPLVQYYRASKAEIVHLRRDSDKAEHSRLRFEARQERLAREEQEKEAKRAARREAAQQRAKQAHEGSGTEEDPIQAAIERARAKQAEAQQGAPDAAQAAIERARQARDDRASEAPRDQARLQLEKAQQRLRVAQAKLAECRQSDAADQVIEALEASIARLTEKVTAAQRQLDAAQEA
ncbi:MAG: electron transport complex subunit RsxC [Halioglobus sp.]|nr:electron transport complex subunit RsxC [Halioglobus sp.]